MLKNKHTFNNLSLSHSACSSTKLLPLGECFLRDASLTQKLTEGAELDMVFSSAQVFRVRRLDRSVKFKRRDSWTGSEEKTWKQKLFSPPFLPKIALISVFHLTDGAARILT